MQQGNTNITGKLKIGTNSLYLGGVSGAISGTANEIYTDNGALNIQSKTDAAFNQNTIINSGNTGKVGIGTATLTEKLNIDGNLKFATANTGVVFNDNSTLKSASAIVKNGASNIAFGEMVQILGDNPMLKIGGLVLQDFSTFSSNGGFSNPITSTPESFVFGNIFWDETKQKYVSIYNQDVERRLRAICGSCVNGGPGYTVETTTNIEGGTAIRFNTNEGNLEFLAIPKNLPVGTSGGFEITKEELLSNVRMVISANGNIGIGKAVASEKLDVAGKIKATSVIISNLAGTGQRMVVADALGNLSSSDQNKLAWNSLTNPIEPNSNVAPQTFRFPVSTSDDYYYKLNCTNAGGTTSITSSNGNDIRYSCSNAAYNYINLADATAKVGIGVGVPAEKLEVRGNVKVSCYIKTTSIQ